MDWKLKFHILRKAKGHQDFKYFWEDEILMISTAFYIHVPTHIVFSFILIHSAKDT